MIIYTSEKVKPYVYMGTHRVTGEFYIGSRYSVKQKLPSHEDIYQYRTSSKRVKPIFDEFEWIIVAEFFDPNSAFIAEQHLIHEHTGNPLLLNMTCRLSQHLFINIDETSRAKMSLAKAGKVRGQHKEITRAKISAATTGKPKPRDPAWKMSAETLQKKRDVRAKQPPHSPETRAKLSAANKGKKLSEETKDKIRLARHLREAARKDNYL